MKGNSRRFSLLTFALGCLVGLALWVMTWWGVAGVSLLERVGHPLGWSSLIADVGMCGLFGLFGMTVLRIALPMILVGCAVSAVVWFMLLRGDALTGPHYFLLSIPVFTGTVVGMIVRTGRLFNPLHGKCHQCQGSGVLEGNNRCGACNGTGVVQTGTGLGCAVAIVAFASILSYFAWTTIQSQRKHNNTAPAVEEHR